MADKIVIAGADEAGRGCVIGPLVIAGISVEKNKESRLKRIGVKDSKLLTPRKREQLAGKIEKIVKDIVIIKTEACKIDDYRKQGISLNRLEAIKFADVVNFLEPHKAYIDGPDVNTEKFQRFLARMIRNDTHLTVEHYADSRYPVVSAASIVAKVARDQEIATLRKKYGDFGSGYPSDPKTIQFLQDWFDQHRSYPECVRKTWMTADTIAKNNLQQRLSSWFRGLGTNQVPDSL